MTTRRPLIVGLGEILWDVFPDGPRFGGAPANFACTAAELCDELCDIQMVSAVGTDPLGQQALATLRQKRVGTACTAQVPYPTGQVHVQLDPQGHASYEFAADVAWDHLPWSSGLEQLAAGTDVVCFGTLGQRSSVSQHTIRRFVSNTPTGCLRLLDVNLRPPFWSAEVLQQSLQLANVLKLNDAELSVVAELLQLQGSTDHLLQELLRRCQLQLVALTRGSAGSVLLRADGQRSELPGQPVQIVDTVGAGDAFTAALVVGLLCRLPLDTIHQHASQVACFVCTQAGGTPRLPDQLRLSADLLRFTDRHHPHDPRLTGQPPQTDPDDSR